MIQQNDTATLLDRVNSGTLIAAGSSVGSWELLSYNCPINPIHAALLRTGKVFFIAGSGNNPNNRNEPQGSAVWNVSDGTFSRPTTPLDATGLPLDFFCAGHSFRPDGRLVVAGGTLQYDPFYGSTATLVFDPSTEQWTKVASMNKGRWYPTLVTLGSGRILALSGLNENGLLDTCPEIYSSSFASGWISFSKATTSRFPMYSHIFLLSSGKLFYSGAYFLNTNVSPRILTLPQYFTQAIAEQEVAGLQNANYGAQGASVLLPPAQDQKVMIIGGGNDSGETTNRVNIVNLKASNPTYTPAAPLNYARMHHNAVLLPDRTVLVCNGSAMSENGAKATRAAEIYNPATNTWTVAATANVNNRLYHSVALLLPDGRVVTAGGNPNRNTEERRLEIYSPPYMSQPRPEIQSAPQTAKYGGTIAIQTPQATNIKWISLLKPMATTHGLDTDQRLVDVPMVSKTSTSLTAEVITNRNLAPAGWYMLFITDNNNVPSVAKWIQLI